MPATYEWIQQTTASGSSTVMTVSSIPQTYTDLVVLVDGNFNGDNILVFSVNGAANNTIGSIWTSTPNTNQNIPWQNGNNSWPSRMGGGHRLQVMNYTDTTNYKNILYNGASDRSDLNSAGVYVGGMTYVGASAITSLSFSNYSTNNWLAGSTVNVWGIKKA
jgi:hypothetical protein